MTEQSVSQATEAVRRRYEEALESFVSRIKQDRYIVAAILYGSLAYDDVWEKSDIDLMLLCRDDKAGEEHYCLVENGISIQANLMPRNKFKGQLERALQGSFLHSTMTRSTLLFSSDETICEYYENIQHVGSRDREIQMLNAVTTVLPILTKAEKWLLVKRDVNYSFLWLMFLMTNLATIEVVWHADVPGREVIQQALRHNPDFFTSVYVNLIQQPKDEEILKRAIQMIHSYLSEKLPVLARPILSYLAEAGGIRSIHEIHEHLYKQAQSDHFAIICDWLADKGVIQRVSMPVRLTDKSRVTLDEAAYYYDGGDSDEAK